MKETFLKVVKKIYYFKDKIAFYPSIIAFLGCLFAYGMMFAESRGFSDYLFEFAPQLVISDLETARTLLTTFIAGLISIMVFSFSMVMILLNQASSNFSPRLLPGLISNRRHQIVLGIYIATILYCIFILVFIEPTGKDYRVPGFSVLLSIVFMVFCLGAFIYFIHSISQEIQIGNIMNKIFLESEAQLKSEIDREKKQKDDFPNTENWTVHKTIAYGYLQSVSDDILLDIAKNYNIKIDVTARKGEYFYENEELFRTNNPVDEDCVNKIHTAFVISFNELLVENYILDFKHLKEIALKAMSPGINDPGTAIYALDYISNLLNLRIQKKDSSYYGKNDDVLVRIQLVPFSSILHQTFTSLRTYCKNDAIVTKKMLSVLFKLKDFSTNKENTDAITKEIELVLNDAKEALSNQNDLNEILSYQHL